MEAEARNFKLISSITPSSGVIVKLAML